MMEALVRAQLTGRVPRQAGSDYDLNPEAAHMVPGDRPWRPAAVLVPLVRHADQLTVLFTQRTDTLKHHAGQVSFPGGRADPGDASPAATALREAEEEIGLAAQHVELLGSLDPYHTVTGYKVQPVVGLVSPGLSLVPQPSEVAAIFEVPLAFIIDPANQQRGERVINEQRATYYEIFHEGRRIWGATAGMIINLARILRGEV